MVERSGLLRVQVEEALSELVARGVVTRAGIEWLERAAPAEQHRAQELLRQGGSTSQRFRRGFKASSG